MEMSDLHVHTKELEFIKSFLPLAIHAFEDGAVFFATDLTKVTYKYFEKFDFPDLEVGQEFSKQGLAARAIQARRPITLEMPRNIYGTRVFAIGGPVWDDTDSEIIGVWAMGAPREHKIVQAFDSFAPVLADLLPEGGFICVTDKEKFVKRQSSKKFDMPELQVGVTVRDDSAFKEAIKKQEMICKEIDESVYGYPVMAASYPLIEEGTDEAVGSFGIALPRKLANDLKQIAVSLDEGLGGVATAIEQITSATNDASANQQKLHDEVRKSKELLDKINNVMDFIKEIADETKMLGLNAAIEAARVGEAGRGFGVVAEEIRKLSTESKKTVEEIRELTKNIHLSMNATAESSESTLAVTEETAAATQEVNASIEELTAQAQRLAQMSAEL